MSAYLDALRYPTDDHVVSPDGGQVILGRSAARPTVVSMLTSRAVAAGPEAHLHHFWRDPANLEHIYMQHSELNLPQGDIFSVSSYDDMCTLGRSTRCFPHTRPFAVLHDPTTSKSSLQVAVNP